MVGFNPEQVATSINGVKSAYNDLIYALADKMQNEFVGGMSTAWACPQAQSFFIESFKPAVDSLINSSNTIFQSVVNAMNSAAANWSIATNTPWTNISFDVIVKTIDTSIILENINGLRGIDQQNANNVKAKLPVISQSATDALLKAQTAVQTSGFSQDQASILINSLGTIKTNIETATNEITTATTNAINNTISAYGDLAGKVQQAFSAE